MGGGRFLKSLKTLSAQKCPISERQFYKVKLAALYTIKFVPKIHANFEKILNDFLL